MKDFSHWNVYEGASEGSGRSEKQWLINPDTNKIGLFKYKKDIETGERYSLEMIRKVLDYFNLFEQFLPSLVFDYLIGNTDRHQSNWAFLVENEQISLSPLYDNSSSLCAYVPEEKIDRYLGNDRMLWKLLVDTKSRSLIRINSNDKRLPTHAEVLRFLMQNYYIEIENIVNSIETAITKERVYVILEKYNEVLSERRKSLIMNYILAKKEIMEDIYRGKG